MDEDPLAGSILDFWFGPPPHAARDAWFRKDDAFDAEIRARYGDAIEAAIGGAFEAWNATPRGALARIVLLDQFTRNAHRDTPGAFAGDPLALAVAGRAVDAGFDRRLDPVERWFVYLPFEHAEDAAAQERSVALFRSLARETGQHGALEWAEKHAAVIRRFGRYPHRNAILGRASTDDEIAFLRQPGSRF
ncbi:hypothetical protein BURK1_00809 [Burkholderiales bacterium]|nr:hypothetical protein BURK1_00809 [Burkholderiales bacterium]